MTPRVRHAAVALALVLFVSTAWLFGTMDWRSPAAPFASLGYNVLCGLAGISAALAARALNLAGDKRGARGWQAMAIGNLLVLAAQAQNILGHDAQSRLISDALALLAYPSFAVAMLWFVPARGSLSARAVQGLDLAILFAAATTVMIAIQVNTTKVPAAAVVTSPLYLHAVPIVAIATLMGAALFFMRAPAYYRPGASVASIAIVLVALSDIMLAVTPQLWDRWSTVEFAFAALLFVIAGARATPVTAVQPRHALGPSRIPYLAVGCVALSLVLTLWHMEAREPLFIAAGGVVVMSMLAVRQWTTLKANLELERRNAETERRLREADRLDALGNMARGVAHDFNGMLLSILTNAELAAEEIDEDPVAAHESVDHIRQAALTARDLTTRLLAFARSGTVEMHEVDCVTIARTQWPVLTSSLPSTVRATISLPDVPLMVRTGPGFVEQVLHNLVTNARDALPSGGELSVALQREGTDAMLTVRDSGVGMDEATRARLFEPFFTTKLGRGSGLGLATVYGIVKQSGGELEVQSRPGDGTTFCVRLPLSAD